MKTNKASKTAQYMALFRALETSRPPGMRLFNDPYARAFLGMKLRKAAQLSKLSFFRSIVESIIHRKIPGALSSGIARTKYIDDLLYYAVNNGARQVLILGAGFDTRGVRLPFLRSIPVVEIDHPNTSAHKVDVLRSAMGRLPGNVTFHQLDFNKESLDDMLTWNPIDLTIPTVVIWEGVTNYLSPSAVENVFRFVSRFAGGSYIIFTYVHRLVLDNPQSFYGAEKLLIDLEKIEEGWTFGFRPDEVKGYLNGHNWALLEDKGATEYRRKYLPHNTERGYEFYRVAFARKRK